MPNDPCRFFLALSDAASLHGSPLCLALGQIPLKRCRKLQAITSKTSYMVSAQILPLGTTTIGIRMVAKCGHSPEGAAASAIPTYMATHVHVGGPPLHQAHPSGLNSMALWCSLGLWAGSAGKFAQSRPINKHTCMKNNVAYAAVDASLLPVLSLVFGPQSLHLK